MKQGRKMTVLLAIILMLGLFYFSFQPVMAGALTDESITLSSERPEVSSTHTISFKVGTTETIKQINFKYQKAGDNVEVPASLDLQNTTKGSMTGLTAANWTLDLSAQSSGYVKLTNSTGEAKTADDPIAIDLGSIINPAIGECTTSNKMYDNCYIVIETFSDLGATSIDSGGGSYYLEEEAAIEFTVAGVNSGVTTNGITTSAATTYNSIGFDHLSIGTPVYAAHRLYVTTTAANGYVVNMKLDGYLQGLFPANKIDPFAAIDAAWSSPQPWSSPTGSVANTDTGWIGANTSDTRVANWENASGKFGPVSSTSHTVMNATGKDTGSNIYLTYAIEVNALQPPDIYSGTILYNITATY